MNYRQKAKELHDLRIDLIQARLGYPIGALQGRLMAGFLASDIAKDVMGYSNCIADTEDAFRRFLERRKNERELTFKGRQHATPGLYARRLKDLIFGKR